MIDPTLQNYSIDELGIDVLETTKTEHYDYKEILKSLDKTSIGEVGCDVVVCVPLRGRHEHVFPCCQYFLKAASNSEKNISFLLIENDESPRVDKIVNELKSDKIGYLHLPSSVCNDTTNLNRSLCYNIGFLLKKPKEWYLSSDIDMLFPPNFFNSIKSTDNSNGFIRPYRFVMMLTEDLSQTLIYESDNMDFDMEKCIMKSGEYTTNFNKTMIKDTVMSSSVGGCSCISPEKFMEIGGYDPELVWGYGPEDQLVWLKLLTTEFGVGELDSSSIFDLHKDEYPIVYLPENIYHMHHAPFTTKNDDVSRYYRVEMNYISIRNMDYEQRMEYINMCSDNLKRGFEGED